ncbi:hypothetical protein A3A14_02255 [Candidatus Daviesbacteria bacterium RIFCSPLOWO2_01_FULL_43_38]|uniref:Uncharacterized protein n=1 Tax=Candidatus Daviesbacteria bacterium RIFCSPHIGHO2_12_FULL_43_11 TaxID=1797780 RepID=A0A1F5K794_9BACT|nr:MAG: hypothetical protein A2874_04130 [Candidatus Daviesbacteria bacterium RIFCSPHIGHO2_01_FULL_43_17]OGE36826.1 MAG: hypothetical protein A3E45_05120 [Candidatus Daviesbacteria bacterium RIFCSPHIGHO2_12_FULL_43_11]OGE63859.1 MAG: hypothetical protein A3A14_02255 [Candidatus Daviesbacteria bacterium RIFCSPLOWO2_01_FULL_43_38]
MPNIGGALKQAAVDVGEAVVKPVTDEVGKAIESGVQSTVSGPQIDPAVQQQKQMEDQKRKAWAIKVIEWNKNLQAAQAKVRQEAQQKTLQQKQEEEAQKQKVQQYRVIEQQKKQQQMSVAQLAARKTEIRRGPGG